LNASEKDVEEEYIFYHRQTQKHFASSSFE
jgi:hypothetical protein